MHEIVAVASAPVSERTREVAFIAAFIFGDKSQRMGTIWLAVIGQAAIATLLEMLSSEASSRMVVGGVPNLTRYGSEFETTVKPVLEALEEQVVLLKLMGEATSTDIVTVRIGRENPYAELQSTSLVASGYGTAVDSWATLGIVGPTRMDYPSTIASVRAVARYVGRFLAEG